MQHGKLGIRSATSRIFLRSVKRKARGDTASKIWRSRIVEFHRLCFCPPEVKLRHYFRILVFLQHMMCSPLGEVAQYYVVGLPSTGIPALPSMPRT